MQDYVFVGTVVVSKIVYGTESCFMIEFIHHYSNKLKKFVRLRKVRSSSIHIEYFHLCKECYHYLVKTKETKVTGGSQYIWYVFLCII